MICEAPIIIQRFFIHDDYRDFRTTFKVLLFIGLGITYILLPSDIVDEETYGLVGMIDDFGIVFGTIIYVSIIIFKAVVQQALNA